MPYLPSLEIPDLNKMNWKEIFDLYDRNFQLILDTLSQLNNRFVIESHTNLTTDIVTLHNSYDLGSNSIAVYCNGIRQWPGESFRELTTNSIKLSFQPEYDDEIKIVIIKVLNAEGGADGVVVSLQAMLVELNQKMNIINDDITDIDSKMQYMTNYDELRQELTQLTTSTNEKILAIASVINYYARKFGNISNETIDTIINYSYVREDYDYDMSAAQEITTEDIDELLSIIQPTTEEVQYTERISRGHITGGIDHLTYNPVVDIVSVSNDDTTYTKGVDYQLTNNGVDWSLVGSEPPIGTTYTCTYVYTRTL